MELNRLHRKLVQLTAASALLFVCFTTFLAAPARAAGVPESEQLAYRPAISKFMGEFKAAVLANQRQKGPRGPAEMVAGWSRLSDALSPLQTHALPRAMRNEFFTLQSALNEQIAIMRSVPADELEVLVYWLNSADKKEFDFSGSKLDADVRARCQRTFLQMNQALAEIMAISREYGVDPG